MLIRRLLPSDDRMAVSRIYEESWKSAYSGIIPQNFLDSIPHGRWCGRLDSSDLTSLVCIESGSFIGTASFTHSRFAQFPDCGEIVSLYLLPQFIGKGYGKALITNAVYELKALGYDKVFLWVLEDNHNARRFYEHMGFIQTDAFLDDCIGGKYLREIAYIRTI